MALATHWADHRPAGALRRAAVRPATMAARHVRVPVIFAVLSICVCFAGATALQMRRDYAHALALAEVYTQAQSRNLAVETGNTLDRLAALGALYAATDDDDARAMRWIEAAEGTRILNIAVAGPDGRFAFAMSGHALAARPLSAQMLASVEQTGNAVPFSDPAIGSSPLTLLFRTGRNIGARIVVIPLDPQPLLPQKNLGETALFAANGTPLARDKNWGELPSPPNSRAPAGGTVTDHLDYDGEARIVSLSAVPGWPLTAAVSLGASDALSTWYGSIPLYLFVIVGPAIAGAALSVLLVREFERADRARSALVAIKAIDQARTAAPAGEAEWLARLAESEERATSAEQAKAEFTAHMSHELRTPLNAVIGFAELIQTGFLGPRGAEKHAEYARDIAAAGRTLHQRIGDILEFAASEFGRQPLRREPVDLCALAHACVERVRPTLGDRRVTLDTRLPDLPPARGDRAAIQRILTIFLSNAQRYTRNEGVIRLDARQEEATLVIGVRDNGFGFSPEEERRATEPFVRFSRPGESGAGMGLGLATALGLARRMGGAVRISGSGGNGTWAELRLPAHDGAATDTNHIQPAK